MPRSMPASGLTHGRDDSEQRYSPLKQITADNVEAAGPRLVCGPHRARPVADHAASMVDGRIYVTTPWSKVYAFDAKTGKFLWKYDPKVPRELAATSLCCNNSNRGVAYWKGKIIWGTLDGRLIAVDAKKGTKVWETLTIDPQASRCRSPVRRASAMASCSSARPALNSTSAASCPPTMPRPASSCGSSVSCRAIRPRAPMAQPPTRHGDGRQDLEG